MLTPLTRFASHLDRLGQFDLADRMDRIAMSRVVVDKLYHTTSLGNLGDIIEAGVLNTERYVSLSEQPLLYGDISGTDLVIVFNAAALMQHLMQVRYDPAWAAQYPEHADYIAGEGWREQYSYEPPDDEDPDWADDDAYEEDYAAAQQDAFEAKSEEREWISKLETQPVPFQPADIVGVIVRDPQNVPAVQQVLQQHGIHAPVSAA